MAKKLYVGGIPYRATEDEMKDFFSVAGNVESAIIIIDRMSGRSKGFGFVEMATEEEAQAAIEKLNGAEMGGRTITVSEAREKKEGFKSDDSGFGGNDQF
ncbi:MAG: RNA-binding protein [Candidatus Pacebacteria bacterium]|nr:RNA-binding protein [Candidatus Paceibacterota bacterium]